MDTKLQERIKRRVTVDAAGCWIWNGAMRNTGYGVMRVGLKVVDVHRAAYTAFLGPIPDKLLVMHRCDVRACCNPEHLQLGTYSENTLDAIHKGRVRPFKTKRTEPLTPVEKEQLMREWQGGVSQIVLCRKFKIPASSLKRVLGIA